MMMMDTISITQPQNTYSKTTSMNMINLGAFTLAMIFARESARPVAAINDPNS